MIRLSHPQRKHIVKVLSKIDNIPAYITTDEECWFYLSGAGIEKPKHKIECSLKIFLSILDVGLSVEPEEDLETDNGFCYLTAKVVDYLKIGGQTKRKAALWVENKSDFNRIYDKDNSTETPIDQLRKILSP